MPKKNETVKRDLAEEITILDTMITTLVDLLEEKGMITNEEWEKRLKQNIKV